MRFGLGLLHVHYQRDESTGREALLSMESIELLFRFERGGELRVQSDPEAKETLRCIQEALPIDTTVYQARWSGREVFLPVNLVSKPPREKQSIRAELGSVIYFREWEGAYDHTGFEAIGLFYGPEIVREWRGDAPANFFGRIVPSDLALLNEIGERVWRQGCERVTVSSSGQEVTGY